MGLFSFIGKAVKGVAKVVGTAAKIGSSLGIIPGGGLIGKAANILLASKRPMATTGIKLSQRDPRLMRGNVTQGGYGGGYRAAWNTPAYGNRPPPAVLRMSPVMPGGAVASAGGMAPRSSAPPVAFGGKGGAAAPTKRRKKKTATKRGSGKRRGRKLKFGSPAWRKKYLGHGRKKRKRAA